jgi:hypothetical protein
VHLTIKNDGKKIVSTNFWESDFCAKGFLMVSVNAGCYRLLVPPSQEAMLKEIEAARAVVISRGPMEEGGRRKADAFELLFEDDSDYPFSIATDPAQWDRVPSDADQGWKGIFHVYIKDTPGPVMEFMRVHYRRVKGLPCLKKAAEQ